MLWQILDQLVKVRLEQAVLHDAVFFKLTRGVKAERRRFADARSLAQLPAKLAEYDPSPRALCRSSRVMLDGAREMTLPILVLLLPYWLMCWIVKRSSVLRCSMAVEF